MAATLRLLEEKIIACKACPRLTAWRAEVARTKRRAFLGEEYWGKPVPGFGDPAARILIVGLAPGAHGSNRTGRMFTGDASGDVLYRSLHKFGFANQPISIHRNDGLELSDVFVSAVCRCVPPGNKPSLAEITNCLPFLQAELKLLERLNGIVALGRIAYDGLVKIFASMGVDLPRGEFRHANFIHPTGAKYWILQSYHPSRQNTQTGRLSLEMFDNIWRLARLRVENYEER